MHNAPEVYYTLAEAAIGFLMTNNTVG